MIVDSMSLQEICQEVYRGFYDIQGKIDKQTKQYQKVVLGRRMGLKYTPIMKTYKFLTKDKMEFVVDYCALTRSSAKEPNVNLKFVYRRNEGLYCGNFALGGNVVILSPHFIQRYKERVAKQPDMTAEEVMNQVFDMMVVPMMSFEGRSLSSEEKEMLNSDYSSKDMVNVVGYAHFGMSYGFKEGKVIMLKTVIGNETINKRQKEEIKTAEIYHKSFEKLLHACGEGTKTYKQMTEIIIRKLNF